MPISSAARMIYNKAMSPVRAARERYNNAWDVWKNSERYKRQSAKFDKQGWN